jgi:hypothetical protein
MVVETSREGLLRIKVWSTCIVVMESLQVSTGRAVAVGSEVRSYKKVDRLQLYSYSLIAHRRMRAFGGAASELPTQSRLHKLVTRLLSIVRRTSSTAP